MKAFLPIFFMLFCPLLLADESVTLTNSEGKDLKVVIINVKDGLSLIHI